MEYQETFKIDVTNIFKNTKTIWRPIYEVIDAQIMKKRIIFHKLFQTSVKVIEIKTQFLPSDVKKFFKKGYVTRVICTSVHDTSKVFG